VAEPPRVGRQFGTQNNDRQRIGADEHVVSRETSNYPTVQSPGSNNDVTGTLHRDRRGWRDDGGAQTASAASTSSVGRSLGECEHVVPQT
jgi:hypothetical protein